MEKQGGIYIIRCLVDFKCYIGSAVDLMRRKRVHFSNLKLEKHKNPHLQNAYNKYGKNNFAFEIIEVVENKEDLLSRENHYIKIFKANDMNFGYNIRKDASSNLGFHHTEDAKRRISEHSAVPTGEDNWQYGKPRSDEVRAKISNTMKGMNVGEDNPMYGKKQSAETIEKRRLKLIGRKMSKEACEKISAAKKGKKASQETREKQAIAKTGTKMSDASKLKMSISHIGQNTWSAGSIQSEESIQKRSLALTGKKKKGKTTSIYVGVSLDKKDGYWHAYINFKKKRYNLGKFLTEIEAAEAYNKKAIELFGENAKTNIIILNKEENAV